MDNKKHKIICMLLLMVPGIFASFIVSLFVSGVIAGVFWLFIFGDNSWPDWTNLLIALCFVLVFLLSLSAFAFVGYNACKKNTDIKSKHVFLSISACVVLFVIVLLNFYKGEIFLHKTNPFVFECRSLCNEQGYNGSFTSPKDTGKDECSCFDDVTNKWVVIAPDTD